VQATYRWYSIKMMGQPIALGALRKKLRTFKSTDCWFDEELGSEEMAFRFFKRTEVLIEQYDASGKQTYSKVESVTAVTIVLVESQSHTLLRVCNPGRNMQALMMALQRVMGFGFSSKGVIFESLCPHSVLQRVDVSKLVGLKLTNVAVTSDCVGRMEFASKEGMNLSGFPLLKGLKYKQDHVKYELLHKGVRGHVSLSASGLVRIGGALTPLILSLVERDVLRIA